jgi:3'(2'),5'-bisphosphate nucleotidase
LGEIALAAGAVILAHRGCRADAKTDGSPVTIADREAESLILDRLGALLPGVPVISEEAAAAGILPPTPGDFLLVDALDGTKEYVAESGEFTVNIALIRDRLPVAAALFAPALDRLWLAGQGAEACDVAAAAGMRGCRNRRRIATRKPPASGITALASRRHGAAATEAYLARFPMREKRYSGSSFKFCLIAEGGADLYPRFSPTMEWDTAAGHAVLSAAGGTVVRADGTPLLYGKREDGFRNPDFIAAGSAGLLTLP